MKKCNQCNIKFKPRNKNHKFCSSKCRSLSYYRKNLASQPKEHICFKCKNKFIHKYKRVKFCSKKCGLQNSRDNNRQHVRKVGREYYWKNRDKKLAEQKKYRDRSQINKKRIASGDAAFNTIKQRCNNPNNSSFKYYGAKGIKCLLTKKEFLIIYFRTNNCERCDIKLSDKNRKKGKNSRTIDRIDSNKNYSINNVQIICRSCQVLKRFKIPDKALLKNLYIIKGKAIKDISIEINLSYKTVLKWIKRYNIPVRRRGTR